MRAYMLMKRRYESYATRSSVWAARPRTDLSFNPRLRTVSIIPGIENLAPDRTLTSSGSAWSPSFLPISFSSLATCLAISLSSPSGQPECM